MTSRLLPLLLAAGALAGEGHAHGPQPGPAQVGPVVLGPEARRNLALATVPAEVRPVGSEAELRGMVRPAAAARAVLAPSTAARLLEVKANPGALLAAGAPVLVLQPLVAGAGKVTLAAPMGGTLLGQLPPVGSVVEAGQHLAEVADLARLAVRGRAMARPLPAIAVGQPASVRLGDRVLAGVVRLVAPAADSPLPALDFEVSLAGAAPSDLGAAARVGIRIGAPSPAIAVPLAAVVGEPGREAVFVEIEPGKFERRAVALGHREAGWVEVVRGVLPGESVATRGAYQLQFAGAAAAPADDHGHGH
ncbi:MAG: efflux RND transporter periplasmic adaptor subunit [Opitutia bacterium]